MGNNHFNKTCKLCDIRDWQEDHFSFLAKAIMGRTDGDKFIHRKLWEFVKCVDALEIANVMPR